jgi:hypothetical protein
MPWPKIRLFGLILAFVGAAGWLTWSFVPSRPADLMRRAVAAQKQVDDDLKANDFAAAKRSCELLQDQIAKLQRALEREALAKDKAGAKKEQFAEWKGEYFYLKAVLLRDRAYAAAGENGKPLLNSTDSSTGELYRNFTFLPVAEERAEAIGLLRNAAGLLIDRFDILSEAVRTEFSIRPVDWSRVKILADATLALRPDDARSLYFVAYFDFEQPTAGGTGKSIDDLHRDAGRVPRSLESINRLKKIPGIPIWRSLFLEAKIHKWRLDDALRRRDAAAAQAARLDLEDVLWGNGRALERARAGEAVVPGLSLYDVEGVLGVFRIAAEYRTRDAKADRARRTLAVVDDMAACCATLAPRNVPLLSPAVLASAQLGVLQLARPAVVPESAAEWSACLRQFEEQWRPVLPKGGLSTLVVALASDLFQLEARNAPPAERETWSRIANEWIDAELRAARAANLKIEVQAPLLAAASYINLRTGNRAAAALQIADLKTIAQPTAKQAAILLESLELVGEGKLKTAQERLDAMPRGLPTGFALRHTALLAQIHRGTGNIDRLLPALRALHEIDRDKFSAGDQVWLIDLVPDRDTLILQMAETHLALARDKHARQLRLKPGQPVAADAVSFHEREAENLIKKLAPDNPNRVMFRQSESLYAHAVKQPERCDELIQAMLKNPAERFAGIMAAEAVAAQPGNENVQQRFEDLLTEQTAVAPGDQIGRLGLVLILARKGRIDAARVALGDWRASSATPGDFVLPEQIDRLARLAEPPELRRELLPLVEAAARRHPHDARIALALGQCQAAAGVNVAAAQQLRRAANLVRGNAPQFSPAERDLILSAANQSLARLGVQ